MHIARIAIPIVASIIISAFAYWIVRKDMDERWDEINKYEEEGEQW